MMPDPSAFAAAPDTRNARRLQPLQGITILLVEDSRFASEAMRLLCQRSGARLRRAGTLESAARHLSLYRPDVVIVDIGLPDGDGADLIRTLTRDPAAAPAVLGTSGDPECEGAARAAGARAFLPKPPASLAAFQTAILDLLPSPVLQAEAQPTGPLRPDTLALQDDLAYAAALLAVTRNATQRRYVAGFLASLAQSSLDGPLALAAEEAAMEDAALPRLAAIVSDRLARAPGPFSAHDPA